MTNPLNFELWQTFKKIWAFLVSEEMKALGAFFFKDLNAF